MNTPPIMIFAAGFGTRMGDLTADRPKPLIPVGGRALLDHALAFALPLNPSAIVVNTHYFSEQIVDHLAGQPGIKISHEPDILETGGGLRAALPLLGPGPVITMNSDAVWAGPNPLKLLLAHWDPNTMEALVLTLPKPQALGHTGKGDFVQDAEGRITRGPGEVYAGVQIIQPAGLAAIADTKFSLNVLWDQMIASGTLFGVSYPGTWCDVGRPEGIAQAEAMLAGANG